MKKLIERMTEENVHRLKQASEVYPLSVGALIKELETKSFYSELTYDVIGVLVSHLGLKSYDPSTISSIFNYE